jgi:hypothetical protein
VNFLFEMARRHSVEVHLKHLSDGVRGYVIPERTIVIDLDLSEERMNWTFCHELAHLLLNHGSAERHITASDEKEAHELAQDLLLPPEVFRADVHRLSLPELKERYPQASWEVIARTRLRYRPGIMTIFDNDRRTLRLASPPLTCPPHLLPLEQSVKQALSASHPFASAKDGDLFVEGAFVDVGQGVERVILIAECEE